jgi:ActR/RegA family two-component response regulator
MNDLVTSNVHLLLVEDNEGYLERALRRLTKFGYQHLDTAAKESEAREKLDQNHYEVIITDMRLGQNDEGGFTIVDEVKQRNLSAVVIILTANDTVADCRKALKGYGCWDYISKSMRERSALEELHHSIQQALTYLNRWGNRKDEKWIEENWAELLDNYRNQYIAVINNAVIETAATEPALKERLTERKLPRFLPVIKQITAPTPTRSSLTELIQQGESATLEFKKTFQYDADEPNKPKNYLRHASLKTLAAFLAKAAPYSSA